MLLIPPLKKNHSLFPPPARPSFSSDLRVYWLFQKATHHPLLLRPSNQALVTGYLMVPAPCEDTNSSCSCKHHSMSYGSGLHPSSGSLFHVVHEAPRSGPIPLCAVIFHLFPPAHCVQDAHCICLPQALHLPLSLYGMSYLHSPCFIPSLPSSPCLPVTEYCLTGALMLPHLLQLSLPFALSPQRIEQASFLTEH